MLTFRFEIVGRLSLAIAVLLASGGTPGVCHAHADGDRSHDHSPVKAHLHRHGRHQHAHSHAGSAQPNVQRVKPTYTLAGTRHVHFSWFGLSFTFPSQPQDESADSASGSTELAIVRSLDVTDLAKPDSAAFDLVVLAMAALQNAGCGISEPALPQFASTPVRAASLCDTARHERSGVQLS
jgi:hypothetical protein